jgi:hypothetical protein
MEQLCAGRNLADGCVLKIVLSFECKYQPNILQAEK